MENFSLDFSCCLWRLGDDYSCTELNPCHQSGSKKKKKKKSFHWRWKDLEASLSFCFQREHFRRTGLISGSQFHREASTSQHGIGSASLRSHELLLSKLNKLHCCHFLHFLHFTPFKPGSHPRAYCGIWEHKPHCQPPREKTNKQTNRNSSSLSTWPLGDTRAECHLWVMMLQTAQALALCVERQEKVCSACSAAQAPFRSSHLPRALWMCGGAFHTTEDKGRKSLGTPKSESFFPGNSTALNSLEKQPCAVTQLTEKTSID